MGNMMILNSLIKSLAVNVIANKNADPQNISNSYANYGLIIR